MPLRVELAPQERLLVGRACIRNIGGRRADFVVETPTKVLRGRYLITAAEADTPCKRLHLAIEDIYLSDDPLERETAATALGTEIVRAVPSTAPYLAAIFTELFAGEFYKALKASRELVEYEAYLLDLAQRNGAPTPSPAPSN
jgi:flagellar biosynthesis repressor protein FlbT